MPTVPYTALQRGPRRWQLVRGDRDADGRLQRGALATLLLRGDGRWEWRACGHAGTVDTRETAESAIVRAWLDRAPVLDAGGGRRRCLCCPELLPAGATRRRKFCSAGCRVSYARQKVAVEGTVPKVRRRSTRPQMGQVERAAARARAKADAETA